MEKVTLNVEGMHCSMCEAHVCDMIRKALPSAKKVKANHGKAIATFEVEEGVDYSSAKASIEAGGYHVLGEKKEPAKKGFHLFR